jgi:hypothetical protein
VRNKIRRVKLLQFYKVMAGLVLICGYENWALNGDHRRNIETAEIKF